MKTTKTLLTALVLLSCLVSYAQQSSIFEKYSDMRNVSSVFISKTMIEMSPSLYTNDVFIGKVAGQLDAVYIVSTMDNNIKKDMRKDIESFIEKGKYELLMKQKGVVSRSAFYVKKKGADKVKELVMITDGAATLKFISLIGDLTLRDIQNITNYQQTSQMVTISGDTFYCNTEPIKITSQEDISKLKGIVQLKKSKYDMNTLDQLNNIEELKELGEELKDLGEELKQLEQEF